MNISTIGFLDGFVDYNLILEFIRKNYDLNAVSDIKTYECNIKYEDLVYEFYNDTKKWDVTNGFITFTVKKNIYNLYYCYESFNLNKNDIENWTDKDYPLELLTSEVTIIQLDSLPKDFNSKVEIVKSIVSNFGGWIDESDCDNEIPYRINKGEKFGKSSYAYIIISTDLECFSDMVEIGFLNFKDAVKWCENKGAKDVGNGITFKNKEYMYTIHGVIVKDSIK